MPRIIKANNPANTPEPKPINSDDEQPPLWGLVIDDFAEKFYGNEKVKSEIISLMQDRDSFGYKKYSVNLKTKNGRSFYNDLLSELLDASVYAKGIIEECETFCDETQDIYFDILKLVVRLYEYQMEKNEQRNQ
jgi:hypothetical protein